MEFAQYLRMGSLEISDALSYHHEFLEQADIKELVDILYRIDVISVKYGGEFWYSLIAEEEFGYEESGYEEPNDGLFG